MTMQVKQWVSIHLQVEEGAACQLEKCFVPKQLMSQEFLKASNLNS